jgi:hypothetical protein
MSRSYYRIREGDCERETVDSRVITVKDFYFFLLALILTAQNPSSASVMICRLCSPPVQSHFLFYFPPFFPLAIYLPTPLPYLLIPSHHISHIPLPFLINFFTRRICCICDRQSAEWSEQERLLRCTASRTPCRYVGVHLSTCPVLSSLLQQAAVQLGWSNLLQSPHTDAAHHRPACGQLLSPSTPHLTPSYLLSH